MTKVLVCGGRDFADRAALYAVLDRLHAQRRFTLLIAGGARGADTMAEQWAKDRGIRRRIFMARWDVEGPAAGPIRNARMLSQGRPDLVVAFPGGKGTAGMVALAREAGVEVSRHFEMNCRRKATIMNPSSSPVPKAAASSCGLGRRFKPL